MKIMAPGPNQAIFSLVGTSFGGDGRETFTLPRLDDAQPGTIWCFSVGGQYPSRR
jgi:microcystin-dependent protein